MIGIAVARRMNANTTRTWAQLTIESGVPVNRTEASSTRYTASWLTTSAAARNSPRVRSRSMTRARNRTAVSPQARVGGRPTFCRNHEATALAAFPARRAKRSLRSMRASTPKAARKPPRPTRAAGSSSPGAPPVAASRPREIAGSRSLYDMFATNVARAESATFALENPHDVYMAYDTPTATAPPAGTVMATVVEDWQTTAACPRLSPGMAATSIGQYVTRFSTANATSTATSADDIDEMTDHTRSRLAIRGRMPTNTATTTAGNSRMRNAFKVLRHSGLDRVFSPTQRA